MGDRYTFEEERLMVARADPFRLPLDIKPDAFVGFGEHAVKLLCSARTVDGKNIIRNAADHIQIEHSNGFAQLEPRMVHVVFAADQAEFFA